ncbi:MAG: flagellar protein FlaG [Oceanospirillaceae bacterium]|jgi:flagellar protein FlaG|nr:flagellar protein FlaG [Oceanospirillaceae bacterium]MBT4441761.1 flagellar protein FlaG [Oceanospirillaceae bacterium]
MAIESLVISHQTAPVVVGHNVESGRFGADSNLVVGRKSKPVPEAPMVDIDREPIISSSELEAKIAELNEALASRNHAIVFSRDSTTGKDVIRVTNKSTGELIRQMPSVEALKVMQNIDHMMGLIFNQKT